MLCWTRLGSSLGYGVTGPRDSYLCWCCFKAASYTLHLKEHDRRASLASDMCCCFHGAKWASFHMALPCWAVPSEGVILLFILSGTELVHPLSLLLGPPSNQGSDLIQNQNTIKFLPSSTMDSFFLDPSFCWRLDGREEKKNWENPIQNK